MHIEAHALDALDDPGAREDEAEALVEMRTGCEAGACSAHPHPQPSPWAAQTHARRGWQAVDRPSPCAPARRGGGAASGAPVRTARDASQRRPLAAASWPLT